MSYRKKIWWLIVLATIVRMLVAGNIELGNDEVYYWTYALHLQYNYFDHPPMVGLLIRFTTANLLFHSELFVRLGAIIASGVCTYLIYCMGKRINNERTGWFAALFYTASLYSSIIAGTFILPDSPQMVFWLWSVLLLVKIKDAYTIDKPATALWIWFGIATGLCIMSKVHGAFLWFGVGLYALFVDRKWLAMKGMYIAVLVSIIIASPIVIWNIQNNFITYTYHGNRVNLNGGGFNIESFGRELLGSLFYNNPINFLLIWIGFFRFKQLIIDKKQSLLLMLLGLPLILVLIGVSMFRDTLPHWSGPGYSTLLLLAAVYLDGRVKTSSVFPLVVKSAVVLALFVVVAGTVLVRFYPGTLSNKTSGNNMGDGDFTLDMYGWQQFGIKMDSLYKADVANYTMPSNARIVVNKWFPAAHIDFYVAKQTGQETYALGNLIDLHHYQWLNHYKPAMQQHEDAYFIVPSNNFDESIVERYKQQFDTVLAPVAIPIYRSNVLCKQYFVYRLKGYK